ncbi:hypothetical protein O181_127464 [Austropuccinia psidii MF-1]|uniref:Uncharacterized protein n=1 Tax=Austropuccinia psidii MF-1 TaxID=1389203 RepID=A0A9Q3Q777_9BASI|nr:hypothetical protein [Austropuccinia psidii MF-1]
MPVQHSPPERHAASQGRAKAVLTPAQRAPLDEILAVAQLRAHLDRKLNVEGAAQFKKEGIWPRRSSSFSGVVHVFPGISRTTFKDPGEDEAEEEENSVEKEGSDGTKVAPAPRGESQGTGGPTLVQSNQPVSCQSKPSSLAIIQQMTQILANLQ